MSIIISKWQQTIDEQSRDAQKIIKKQKKVRRRGKWKERQVSYLLKEKKKLEEAKWEDEVLEWGKRDASNE